MIYKDTDSRKIVRSKGYNHIFNKVTGFSARWGKTPADDPDFSPVGPEIADIEISTICHGVNNKPCAHCYKSLSPAGKNMSLATFKKVLNGFYDTKGRTSLTQIAFGIGDIDANPDLFDILEYTRNRGIIPNITINGARMNELVAAGLAGLCGAVSVSRYEDKNVCYNAVKELTARGHSQINIHQLLSESTYESCFQLVNDIKSDERLSKLNAVVFLLLKPKGKRNTHTKLGSVRKFRTLMQYAMNKGVNIGFDSCTAPLFLKAVKDQPNYEQMKTFCEPCESWLFSIYVDVSGNTYPCSFLEEQGKGISLLENTVDNVWNGKAVEDWRTKLLGNTDENACRMCPAFDVY